MDRKEELQKELQEKAARINKEMLTHLRKIIESLEVGNGCEEAECFYINTSTKCFVQACEEMLELINLIKIKVIVGNQPILDDTTTKEAKKSWFDIKKLNSRVKKK